MRYTLKNTNDITDHELDMLSKTESAIDFALRDISGADDLVGTECARTLAIAALIATGVIRKQSW